MYKVMLQYRHRIEYLEVADSVTVLSSGDSMWDTEIQDVLEEDRDSVHTILLVQYNEIVDTVFLSRDEMFKESYRIE